MRGWIYVHHYRPDTDDHVGALALVNLSNVDAVQSIAGGNRALLVWNGSIPRITWDTAESFDEVIEAIEQEVPA
jgi:hypothetical protein